MKYHVTSAEAAKLLKKLLDEKSILLADEYRSSTFNAALGEDVESVRPVYDYAVTQQALEHCNRKIRLLKHAINCFNTTQLVGDTGMTIDQVLVISLSSPRCAAACTHCRTACPSSGPRWGALAATP